MTLLSSFDETDDVTTRLIDGGVNEALFTRGKTNSAILWDKISNEYGLNGRVAFSC